MSWEIAVVICVTLICGTILVLHEKPVEKSDDFLKDRLSDLLVRLHSIEEQHQAILKTHEDTKTLLSKANIASIVRQPR